MDIDDEGTMSAPKKFWIQQFEQILKGTAVRMTFNGVSGDADSAFFDRGEADITLLH